MNIKISINEQKDTPKKEEQYKTLIHPQIRRGKMHAINMYVCRQIYVFLMIS